MNNNSDSNIQTGDLSDNTSALKGSSNHETEEEKSTAEEVQIKKTDDIAENEMQIDDGEEKKETQAATIDDQPEIISSNQHAEGPEQLEDNIVPDNNESENDEMSGLGNLANAISNTHLMSEESIETLREILCSKDNIFYKLNLKDPDLNENIQNILKLKGKIAENTIGEALNYYHQRFIDSELGHLDKLMKILKSKKRDMYLKKINSDNQDEEKTKENDNINQISQESMMNQFENSAQFTEYALEKSSNILKKLLPEYNSQHRYIRFQLNQHYEVYLRVYDEKVKTKTSMIDRIPTDVLQNHIFMYFNSLDLFKLRGVCCEWRDIIRATWHSIFKREMMEQVIAADLCNDIEMNFKLMNIKSMFYHKFGILMKAITELIDWDSFKTTLENQDLDYRAKYLVITYYKMIGTNVGIEKMIDFTEELWEGIKQESIEDLKENVEKIFAIDFKFDSNFEMDVIKKNFLDVPDISSQNIRNMGDKNLIMFQLFLRQLSVFSQLKNYLSLAQTYIIFAKNKLKEVSKEWPHKKGFLEGAYKILLFKFVQIKNGEVIIAKDDEDEHKHDILKDIQNELHQCMNITSEIHASEQDLAAEKLLYESNKTISNNTESVDQSNKLDEIIDSSNQEKTQIEMSLSSEKETQIDHANETQSDVKTEQAIPEKSPTKDSHDIQIEDLMNFYLAKIIEIRKGNQNQFHDNFLKGENPDYVIAKNGSETRLYLDDMIKIELLIQKYLKLHLWRTISKHEDEKEKNLNQTEKESALPNSELLLSNEKDGMEDICNSKELETVEKGDEKKDDKFTDEKLNE